MRRRTRATEWLATTALAATAMLFASWSVAATQLVSQRNRSFQPAAVTIGAGHVLRILNDDGELLHHVQVTEGFRFDSGEQEPGRTIEIRFPGAGTYTVRCAIHPRMRLAVTVQ